MSQAGKLTLLPNFLHPDQSIDAFSEEMKQKIADLDGCIVESEKSARALFKHFKFNKVESFRELPMYVLSEHTVSTDEIMKELRSGKNLGLISDAGLPMIADPGANVVFKARQMGMKIQPVGVYSSVVYALMASGLASQAFYFVGYLPKEEPDLVAKLKQLEKLSQTDKATILFIETPYRNEACLKSVIKNLSKTTYVAICQDLCSKNEHVYLERVDKFNFDNAKVQKSPAVFVFRA